MTPSEIKNLRIIVADSNSFLARTLGSVLEVFKVGEVYVCPSIENAEQKLHSVPIDCIFIDFMMENRSGLQFIKRARSGSSPKIDPSIPIILVTGMTDIETITRARDMGVTEVISKPFSPEQILMKLDNAINNKRAFINVDDYIGPSRRRRQKNTTEWIGENDRRKTS